MISNELNFNVAFKGGIADVKITPTPAMTDLVCRARVLRSESDKLMQEYFEIGQSIAEREFVKKHANY